MEKQEEEKNLDLDRAAADGTTNYCRCDWATVIRAASGQKVCLNCKRPFNEWQLEVLESYSKPWEGEE